MSNVGTDKVDGEEEEAQKHIGVISCFCREVDEINALLGYCAAYSDNFLPTFRDNLSNPSASVLDFLTIQNMTDRLSQNVSKEFSPYAS